MLLNCDFVFFREIAYIKSGLSLPLQNAPSCRCPDEYPNFYKENGQENEDLCTRDGLNSFQRFNTTTQFYEPDVLTDGNDDTKWASSQEGDVTLMLEFKVSYEVNVIK